VGYLVYNGISEMIKEFLIPSLEAVKVRFEISEIMAGVTLLAFGNGAGDVLTALVASSYPGGIDYNIGATMGAGFVIYRFM
jgi:sodium/potassium/calcium exchanger 6